MCQNVLLVIDNFYPHRSAGSVRISSFYKQFKKIDFFNTTVVGGSFISQQSKNEDYFLISRPSENRPVLFIWFLLRFIFISSIKILRNDVVIISVPKYEILFLAIFAHLFKKQVIIDLRDSPLFLDYNAYLSRFLPSRLAKLSSNTIKTIIFAVLKKSANVSEHILVANTGIKSDLQSILSKKDLKKIAVIENGIDEPFLKENPVKKEVRSKLTLGYIGNFSEKDLFEPIIETFKEAIELDVLLIGSGRNHKLIISRLNEFAGDNRVKHIGEVNHQEIPKIIKNKIDLGFIFRAKNAEASIPVSVIEFISLGVPVVVNDVGKMSDFVKQYGGFVVKNQSDFIKLINKVNKSRLRPILTNSQTEAVRKKFNRDKLAERLIKLLLC